MEIGDMKTPIKNFSESANRGGNIQINNPSSPFRLLPDHTTPPSRFIKIKNPFKAAINDQLHKHIFSPSVFSEVKKSKGAEKFRWTIEDMSILRPAQIDMNTVHQLEQSTSEDDVEIQSKIEKFFNENQIVESPMTIETTSSKIVLLSENESPDVKKYPNTKESCDVWTQTVLSLPPKLPENLENALKPYFTFNEDQRRQTVDLNSSLCRRLFHFEPETEEPEDNSIHSEISFVGSPIIEKNENDKKKRTYDSSPETPANLIPNDISPILSDKDLDACQISPVTSNLEGVMYRGTDSDSLNLNANNSLLVIDPNEDRKQQSFAKADFSGHMSVDGSFNLAPENDFVVGNQTNPSDSPSNEFLEANNWDLEYNNFSINTRSIRRNLFENRENNFEKMDISNLTTPKSKIISSQRKKLSDSFRFSESSEEEILNFDSEENIRKLRKLANATKNEENTQDTGYTTELSEKSNFNDDEDMMMIEGNNFYSSTPSKRYFSGVEK